MVCFRSGAAIGISYPGPAKLHNGQRVFDTVHTLSLRAGEPRGLKLRECSKRDLALTIEATWCGQPLGQHTLALDGPPVTVPLAGGQLELSLVRAFEKPHLRVRFDGVDVPGSQFHPGTHRRHALLRGLAALGATVVGTAAAAWSRETIFTLVCAGAAAGVLGLLWWIRQGSRPAVFLAMALTASVAVGSLFLLSRPEFDGILMLAGLSAYDLLFVLTDRMWMEEIRRKGAA
jgi:hypothetical protein